MRRFLRRTKPESLTAWRDRLIAENELALLVGLRFPHRFPRIPAVEVCKAQLDQRFAMRFWSEALGVDEDELKTLNQPPSVGPEDIVYEIPNS